MTPAGDWPRRIAPLLDATGPPRPLGGQVWLLPTGTGDVVVKTGPGTGDEADGLQHLGRMAGGPPVPEIVMVEPGVLVTRWVDHGPRTPAHDEALGRTLATLHSGPCAQWGGGSSWVGSCRVDPSVRPDGGTFYRTRLLELGARCGLGRRIDGLGGRIDELVGSGPPAVLHGDLWWGNVLWGTDGRAWLVDPSVHGGHPEEDLAMLGLFGPVPDATWHAYTEVRPVEDGWEQRSALFRLYPLLVHTVLFGGGYRRRAEALITALA